MICGNTLEISYFQSKLQYQTKRKEQFSLVKVFTSKCQPVVPNIKSEIPFDAFNVLIYKLEHIRKHKHIIFVYRRLSLPRKLESS